MSYSVEHITYNDLVKQWDLTQLDLCYQLDWKALLPDMEYLCIKDKSGKIQAAFTLYFTKRKGLKHISNMPYFQHCGLVIAPQSGNNYEKNSKSKRLLKAMAEYIDRYKWVNMTLPSQIVDTQPFIWNEFSVVPRYTYQLDLSLSHEEITSNFSKALKSDQAKLEALDITFHSELTNPVMQLLEESTFSHRNPSENTLGKNILKKLAERDNMHIVVAQDETSLGVACVVETLVSDVYLFGGSNKSLVSFGTAALLKAIEQSKSRGQTVFDFEGSMISGVEKYFRSFGAQITPYYQVKKEPTWLKTTKMFG